MAAGAGREHAAFAGVRLAAPFRPRLIWLAGRLRFDLRTWLERELAERAGFQWLAVAFGAGCLAYFALPREPLLAALLTPALLGMLLAAYGYRAGRLWRIASVVALGLAGASTAKLRVDSLSGPQIERPFVTELSGRVIRRDTRAERRPRLVLDNLRAETRGAETRGAETLPGRIRLSLGAKQGLPPLGARISVKARLLPVAGPTVPGGYDPRRAAFFEGIGGTGFVLGGWRAQAPPARLSGGLALARVRAEAVQRITALAPGEAGAVAAALLVGERSALSEKTNESLRISGLAHILSISGLHMMLIAGAAFFAVRAALALSPTLALTRPIRKWAAVAALIVVTVYLALSGGGVATVRAYVMAVVMFAAILVDRPPISMRNLAIAAFVVLATEPESVTEPGFQMSFSAVAALIAAWDVWQDRRRRRLVDEDALPGLRMLRFIGRAVFGVALTSLVAGLATAPFAAYHFERAATYSLLGNLLAAPLVSAIIMPFGLMTLLIMPIGLEALPLAVMVWGIDALLWVSDWVASLPGADLAAPRISALSLILMSAGLLWLCLWRLRWRLLGIPAIGLGLVLVPVLDSRSDILVAPDGTAVAVRDAGGVLRVSGARAGSYVVEQFLDEEGAQAPDAAGLRNGVRCDELACILPSFGALEVAHVRDPVAFAEDCRRVDIIVTPLRAPADCQAMLVIDAKRLEHFGAHAVRIVSDQGEPQFDLTAERSAFSRPWQTGSGVKNGQNEAPSTSAKGRSAAPGS
ncbi:MAG: ComEC/Rec2 family competence protein [Rhizobiales bacterium]|nr:ComEC/Rec2 family competence protein [Hyphomicrobiales bacterium]